MDEKRIVFDHHWNADAGILEMTNSGFWSPDTVDRYIRERDELVRKIRKLGGPLKMLVDTREMTIQSAEVIDRVEQDRKQTVLDPKDRIAVVVSSQLLKMQIARTNLNRQFQFFTTIEEARDWLMKPS